MIKLGVNIDHVATLRQARKGHEPDVVQAAKIAMAAGADGITVHLREDRRHIQDQDVRTLKSLGYRLNLEMAATPEMIQIACAIKPDFCCLVPEKRQEITTEGGLNVLTKQPQLQNAISTLIQADIAVSIFIDPIEDQLTAAAKCGATYIELHTGTYANHPENNTPLKDLHAAAKYAHKLGLKVNAGHGLTRQNILPILTLPHLEEVNIGHSIISRAIFVGLHQAVSEIKLLLEK